MTANSSDEEGPSARAAASPAAAANTVTNAITYEDIPRRFAIEIDKQWYDPVALSKWIAARRTIPHTRQPVTDAQRNAISRSAAAWAQHQGLQWPAARPRQAAGWRGVATARKAPRRAQLPDNPERSVYFRRYLPGSRTVPGGNRFKYFKAVGAQTVFRLSRDRQSWQPMPTARLQHNVLVNTQSRVDVSLDFAPASGQGHWEQLRYVTRVNQLPIDRWARGQIPWYFYAALERMLPPVYAHIWTGYT